MSEGRKARRDWAFYLDDMIGFAERVLVYTADLDQAGFLADRRTYDATLRNPDLIGEAATHVPEAARAASPEVPWRLIVATRNRVIHGCLGIDDDTLWSIVRDDIPGLLPLLRALRARSDGLAS